MGLTYTDVGSALGRLKSQMFDRWPQGQGWDLIIIASESKNAASGEFYQYASEALDKGSSVIYELWYLDERMGASGEALLSRCGIEFPARLEGCPAVGGGHVPGERPAPDHARAK